MTLKDQIRIALINRGQSLHYQHIWIKKWSAFKDNGSGGKCRLTFDQYLDLALQAGISDPNNIGIRKGQYQMGRIGDSGIYELGNCRFITKEQNLQERIDNGGSVTQSVKMSGRTKETHVSVATSAFKNSKNFVAFSPDGEKFEGRNVKQFCLEHGLNVGNFSRVCQGLTKHSKGWTGYYI